MRRPACSPPDRASSCPPWPQATAPRSINLQKVSCYVIHKYTGQSWSRSPPRPTPGPRTRRPGSAPHPRQGIPHERVFHVKHPTPGETRRGPARPPRENPRTHEKRAPTRTFVRWRPVSMVREGGVEPPRPFGHWNLNPARLPIPPPAHWVLSWVPHLLGAAPGDMQKISTLRRVDSHPFVWPSPRANRQGRGRRGTAPPRPGRGPHRGRGALPPGTLPGGRTVRIPTGPEGTHSGLPPLLLYTPGVRDTVERPPLRSV